MALANLAVNEAAAGDGPIFMDRIEFDGDDAYVAGGTADFEAAYQALVGANRTIVAVLDANIGNEVLQYDHANDKLMVRLLSTGAEVGNGDLSGTKYHCTIVSK
jgi:hypothetical protein